MAKGTSGFSQKASALAAVTDADTQWARTRQLPGVDTKFTLQAEESGLRGILLGLPPDIRRNLRRTLRHTGDQAIAEMTKTLEGALPGGIAKVDGSRQLRQYTSEKTGKTYYRYGYEWKRKDRTRGESSGTMRRSIVQGLRTRVVAGKTRSGITLSTTKAKMPDGKQPMVNAWNAKKFRHPVFGRTNTMNDTWADQQGQPYFFHPAIQAVKQMRADTARAIEDAVREASNR